MLPYDDALQAVLNNVQRFEPGEAPTVDAGGLVLAEGANAKWDMPHCDNSAMDGYAFEGQVGEMDTFGVIGASYAGHPFNENVPKGQSIRITTGAALAKGTDTVIPLEEAREEAGLLRLQAPISIGQHVRRQGEEFQSGEQLLKAGTLLQAGEISLLASAGVDRVSVYPQPQVAIISTGDELVELGEAIKPGQIVNSNLYFLMTRLQECGCKPVCIGIGKDNTASLDQCIAQAKAADMIISTGGVSVGEKDQVQSTLENLSFEKIFWKVAIKPGKPLLFGLLEQKPFFGLPGNPAATAATFEIFVKPALRKISGHTNPNLQTRRGILTEDVHGGGKRQLFLWCHLEWHNDQYKVTVQSSQGSGQNRSIQGANALLAVPVGTLHIARGETVEVLLLE